MAELKNKPTFAPYTDRKEVIFSMIIIEMNENNDSLDKALRRFKKKFERIGILKETRRRSAFNKPSVQKTLQRKKAISRQRYFARENY